VGKERGIQTDQTTETGRDKEQDDNCNSTEKPQQQTYARATALNSSNRLKNKDDRFAVTLGRPPLARRPGGRTPAPIGTGAGVLEGRVGLARVGGVGVPRGFDLGAGVLGEGQPAAGVKRRRPPACAGPRPAAAPRGETG
jgi:hypothetical protein